MTFAKVKIIGTIVLVLMIFHGCDRLKLFNRDATSCWGILDNYPYSAIDNCTQVIQSGRLSNERLAEAFFDRGRAYLSRMDYDRAIHDFSEAIHLKPEFAAAFFSRGRVYFYYKFDSNRALTDLDETVRLNPDDASAFDFRATIYASKNDYEHANESLNEAKRLNPVLMAVKREVCGGEDICDLMLREGKRLSFKNYQIYFYVVGGTGYGTVAAVLRNQAKDTAILKVFKGLGSNGEVLEVNPKVLDGKDYLEVYETTSKGNGSIELFQLEGTTVSLVFDARAVDQHDDGSMFDGGMLRASYHDINDDGHFDIILDGAVVSSSENTNGPARRRQCKRVFLWSDMSRKFQETRDDEINPELCTDFK